MASTTRGSTRSRRGSRHTPGDRCADEDLRQEGRHVERPERLGELLVADGLISKDDLDWALKVQAKTRSRLGSILVASGRIRRLDLARALARHWHAPFVDALSVEVDPALLEELSPERLAKQRWVPLRARVDGTIEVATSLEPTLERCQEIAEALKAPVALLVTSEWDIDVLLQRYLSDEILDQASLGLWRRDARWSARTVASPAQKVVLLMVVGALVAGLILDTAACVAALAMCVAVAFLVSVAFKFATSMVGLRYEGTIVVSDEEAAALLDAELPTYSVLVPLYREAAVVPQLIANLAALDYPAEKLEILLLLEEDDEETRRAAIAAKPPETMTFLTVPKGVPQTKPKACNVGLFFAKGDLLVIYDAEDRPEPDQLRKAAAAFARGGDDLVCVQAALSYFNATENALTRMFTLEYSFWFDDMLPGLEALGLPIPLGGTSNHFRTNELRRLGGWDPFNVTEDADLGVRAAALGKRVGVLASTTYEEANNAYRNFVRQRSRWIKGYLQTSLVFLRHPIDLVRAIGWRQSLGFLLLITGTPLSFLAVPPLYSLLVVSLILPPARLAPYFPGWVLWASLADLLVGNALMVYVSMMGVFTRRLNRLAPWALLNPLYWLLHAAGAYKALFQLVFRPHYWEKTIHGLTRTTEPVLSAGPEQGHAL
jgi:cellulose synthase/poly-beta-1,6-N-acetylglucosamine synthase-like glycosyltransferase